MEKCTLCPVECGAERNSYAGACGVKGLTVAKYYLHPFEEPCISFAKGSGTVFFGGCNLKCVFCQNYEVSRAHRGKAVTPDGLADIFRSLEAMGADNINLVTPDHVSHLVLEALKKYRPHVPVVYNTGGYCKREALEAIDPYIDIYLPDVKFFSPALSERYTGRSDYFEYARAALDFMKEKEVRFDDRGKMLRGSLVRHLVMPMCASDSIKILDYCREVLPEEVPISLMRQYTPMGNSDYPELNRRVTDREYRRVVDHALSLGFKTLYIQEKESAQAVFIPEWDD